MFVSVCVVVDSQVDSHDGYCACLLRSVTAWNGESGKNRCGKVLCCGDCIVRLSPFGLFLSAPFGRWPAVLYDACVKCVQFMFVYMLSEVAIHALTSRTETDASMV